MATESPANGVSTTLSAAITNTATSLSLASATGFPNGQYACLLDDGTNRELVEASALSGTTLTVARASEAWAGAATAYAFGIGTKVTIVTSVQSVIRLIQGYAPAVAPAATVTGPDAFGAASVVGTSALYAREDHDHGLPAAPSPALTVNTTTAASVAVPLNVATTIVTSPSLPTGTYLLFADIQFSFVAAPSVVATLVLQLVAGTATMTIPDGVTYLAQYEPIGTPPSNAITLSKMFAITITVAGTVSLNLTSYNEAGTASPAGNGGIVAVKIA